MTTHKTRRRNTVKAAVLLVLSVLGGATGTALAQAPAGDGGVQAEESSQRNAGRQQTLTLDAAKGSADTGTNTETGSVMFVGNATVIIRYAGFTILTDPNFLHKGEHVHLGYGLTAERLTEPALSMEQLPQIDLVLLSHFHGDHFDQLVRQKLDRNIPIVTTPKAAEQLAEHGFNARHALDTWDALMVKKGEATLRITGMPGRHGPPVVASLLPQVMGSMLEFSPDGDRPDYRIYISGDTMVYDDIREIPQRYPDIDLALLHLGGTRILGLVKVTMDGKDGVEMLQIIAPHHAIPIHYNDYDVFKSPLSDFEKEVKAADLQGRITYLKHGDTYEFKPVAR
jgi:L-ascorbate metabolism protein UlaG (beta-lactamase superfamily)